MRRLLLANWCIRQDFYVAMEAYPCICGAAERIRSQRGDSLEDSRVVDELLDELLLDDANFADLIHLVVVVGDDEAHRLELEHPTTITMFAKKCGSLD